MERLGAAYRRLWRVQAALRLLADRVTDPEALGEGARAFLLREAGESEMAALLAGLAEAAGQAEAVIEAAMG